MKASEIQAKPSLDPNEDDQSSISDSFKQRPRLTLRHLNKLRKIRELRRLERAQKAKEVHDMYDQKSDTSADHAPPMVPRKTH